VRIRVATACDMDMMIAVVNAAFAVEHFIEGTRTDAERMLRMMQKGEFLVAEDGTGRVVASAYTELRGERGYFGMLAVDPSRQGRGLGRVMIEAAEDHCRVRGCRWMDISVLTLRQELLPFYRKLGYAETRMEEFRPSRPLKPGFECRSIVMSKAL
jgi:GNAT superfamily N-acetyltransferase